MSEEKAPKSEAEASDAENAESRLNELLRRSKVFADFVAGKGSCSVSDTMDKSGKRRRMKESEEDAILLKQGQEMLDPVRLEIQPKNIEYGTMRQYQINALNWMIRLHDIGCNGILADEMGLGKTLESISLLAYLKQYRQVNGPHLVIVPKSTSGNWVREFKRWCPSLSLLLFHGSKDERALLREKVGTTDVCVTTYEMCNNEKGILRKINWYFIYIDEAHRIKNEESRLSLLVRSFPSKRRLLITGTPLQNNLHELWALLNFLLPDVFDSATDFSTWFDVTKSQDEDTEKNQMVRRLHSILRPFLLRRLKKDVEKDLPPKVEMKVFTGLSVMQKAWYTKLLERDIHTINSKSGSKMRLLNIVMQLRKVCNHPYLFDGAEEGPPYIEGEHIVQNCGKMVLLDKLLKRLKAQGSRVLIFSQMTRMIDILEDYCRYRRYKYCRIDGQTKQSLRDSQMDEFNAPDSSKFIFLLSTRAGGLGINLQTADTVVLYDSDWNPQMDLQAMDRAHRIGQKKQVNVYRFVTDGTIEVKVVERAYKKLFLNAVVIREGRLQEKGKGLQSDELMKMVRFGAKEIFRSKDATVSDEDIEEILRKSKERSEKDKKEMENSYDESLRDFSLDITDSNYQTFEGKDYANKSKDQGIGWFIAPTKRERKLTNYNTNVRITAPPDPKKPKKFKPTIRHDFQFFQRERLAELEKKMFDAKFKWKEDKREAARQKKIEDKKKRAEDRRERERRAKLEKKIKREQAAIERAKALQAAKEKAEKEQAEAAEAATAVKTEDTKGGQKGEGAVADTQTESPADPEKAQEEPQQEPQEKPQEKKPQEPQQPLQSEEEQDANGDPAPTAMEQEENQLQKPKTESTNTPTQDIDVPDDVADGVADDGGDDDEKNHDKPKEEQDGDQKNTSKMEEEEEEEEEQEQQPKEQDVKKEMEVEGGDGEVEQDKKPKLEQEEEEEEEQEEQETQVKQEQQPQDKEKELPQEQNDIKPQKEQVKEPEQLPASYMSFEEQQEKEDLEKEGFGSWSRQNLNDFVAACARFGREDVDSIKNAIQGQPEDEVERYHSVFWPERYKEIRDAEKIISRIEKGEKKLKQHEEDMAHLAKKVSRHKKPLQKMTIPYTSSQANKGFTPEEDRFLVVAMHEIGYGEWDGMKQRIRNAWQFRFDWFIKSRTTKELQQRCKKLLDLVKEDNAKWDEQQKNKQKKQKGKKKENKGSNNKSKNKAKNGKRKRANENSNGKKKSKK